MTNLIKLGTRRSALAWVQSSQIAAALQAAHPGLTVELVGIDTRGDRVLDVPLSAIEGKEFFTAEIDAALREGRVDCTVHSLKDLSLERPADLVLAAVPRRANPRDIAIFAADVPQRLAAGAGLRIGTSSPRRAELLPPFLSRALPFAARNRIELVNLRGNVDSRLRRLREPRGAERHLDGVVLALAGLSRLYADTTTQRQGRALLDELLDGLPYIVMPLTEVPGAPGQGALAVECRANDAATRALLAVLEDSATRNAITVERQLLATHGGGCHQRFGATLQWLDDPILDDPFLDNKQDGLLNIAGRSSTNHDLSERRWLPASALSAPASNAQTWDGSIATRPETTPLLNAAELALALDAPAVFIAHWRALPSGGAAALQGRQVWTPGSATWFELAAQGVWVSGCAESLGATATTRLLSEPVLRLPPLAQWQVLTHRGAEASWHEGAWNGARIIGTYAIAEGTLPDAARLATATHVYWHSVAQFERGRSSVRSDAHHASGPGKTAAHIRAAGVQNFRAFPSVVEWRQWIAPAR